MLYWTYDPVREHDNAQQTHVNKDKINKLNPRADSSMSTDSSFIFIAWTLSIFFLSFVIIHCLKQIPTPPRLFT